MLQIWGYHISSYLYEFAYVIPHSGLLIFSYLNTLYLCIRNNKLFKGYSFFFIRVNNIFQEVNFLNKYIFAMDSLDQIRALVHTLPSSDFVIRAIEAATSGITIADFQSEDMLCDLCSSCLYAYHRLSCRGSARKELSVFARARGQSSCYSYNQNDFKGIQAM